MGRFLRLTAAGTFIAAALAANASAEELRLLSGFDQNSLFTREVTKPFMDGVTKATGGAITFRMSGPETVPPFEQLQPTSAGLFQVLVTHSAYHPGTTAVGLAVDAFPPDPVKRRESGLWDFIDQHYAKHGLKLIALPPTGSKGYQFALKKPIESAPGLKGRKIRGTISYHPLIEAVGGSPVVMPGGDVYTAMERGVIDGAAWATTGLVEFKWHEVSGYLARPTFGQNSLSIFMNLNAWKKLKPDQQEAISKVAAELEQSVIARFNELMEAEFKELAKLGMKETHFPPEEAAQLDRLWSEGVLKVAADKSGPDIEKMKELARKGGLAD